MATDDEVDKIRAAEPGVPNIGGADGPDRPPPRPPAADADMPVSDTPMQTPRESWTDRDESLTGPESDGMSGGSPPTSVASSQRSRSTRRGGYPSAASPQRRSKWSRPPSLTSRGAVNRRKADQVTKGASQVTPGCQSRVRSATQRLDPLMSRSSPSRMMAMRQRDLPACRRNLPTTSP